MKCLRDRYIFSVGWGVMVQQHCKPFGSYVLVSGWTIAYEKEVKRNEKRMGKEFK